jgi:hypothetical protein
MLNFKALRGAKMAAVAFGVIFSAAGQAAADQVIPDDLIVQGSACVGVDCVKNESFGFATIRLKENNTRIDFVDTSGTGFPTRDWRLEANSSAAGSDNYFAIMDMGDDNSGGAGGTGTPLFKVTAGAPANSIFVSSSGRVGFRTSTPALDLHVVNGNTPALRMEQNGSGGFAPQTWDVAGNEANFFVRDLTGGSRLPFRIRPGAPTSSIDINGAGNVGMGTASPTEPLHLFRSGLTDNVLFRFQNGKRAWSAGINGAGDFFRITDQTVGVSRLAISNTGNIGIGTTTPAAQLHTTGTVRFAGVANCATGIRSNATGDLSCMPPATPTISSVASSATTKTTLASLNGSTASTAPDSSTGSSTSAANSTAVGCSEGDMAGSWSMFGTNIADVGANSVLWCDVQFTKAGQNPIQYSVSGNCRNHATIGATPFSYVVSGDRSITVTPACKFSGDFKITDSKSTVTATIVEGQIESVGTRKTRAVGVSRWPNGKTFALQTFTMQR